MIAQAQGRIDELYRLSALPKLLRAFANTAAFAKRGLGVDYDPDPRDIMVGVSGAGVQGDVAVGTVNPLAGSFINFAVMAGVNLGRWGHPRWTVFASGFHEGTTINGLEGKLGTFGAHVQYRLVPPTQPGGARWMGVMATSGLEYARWTLGTAGSVESHFTAEGPNEHKTVHMSSTGTLTVLTSTFTVPLEVTTAVRLANTFVLCGGLGLDLAAGSSTVEARLDSLLTINSERLPIGNAVITGSDSGSPSPFGVRALGGFGIHTGHVRVSVLGAYASDQLAVSIGVRIAP
jgi:hypothetical protein